MDIKLDNLLNIDPERAYVSIRSGETRKQVSFTSDQILHFPKKTRNIVVDVFEKVGSKQVSLDGIQANEPGQRSISFDKTGKNVNLAFTVTVGENSEGKAGYSEEMNKSRSYLESKNVQVILSELVKGLLAEKPGDPLAFMASFVKSQRDAAPAPVAAQADKLDSAGTCVQDGALDLSGHCSLLADVLSNDPMLYNLLKPRKTKCGITLDTVIKPGVENKGHRHIMTPGVVAGDAECYSTFQPLLDKIMNLRWSSSPAELTPDFCQRTALDPMKVDTGPIDPTGGLVVSVSARLGRNLRELRFLPACSQDERRRAESALVDSLLELCGEFAGEYYPLGSSQSYPPRLGGMTPEEAEMLKSCGALFADSDAGISISSGFQRDWPDARGVFAAESGSVWAWINQEEHLQLFATDEGTDLHKAFQRLCHLEAALRPSLKQRGLEFARCDRLGFLMVSPLNVGTGLIATVNLKIPLVGSQEDFRIICRGMNLQARKTEKDTWAVSNSERLGTSEVEQINTVIAGCRELVKMELALQMTGMEEPLERRGSSVELDANFIDLSEVPGLGEDEYPGFPVNGCPEPMPNMARHFSLMAEVLKKDPSVYNRLKDATTPSGVSFARVIKSGMDKPGHAMIKTMGAMAGDEASYVVFQDLFEPLVSICHKGFTKDMKHKTMLQDVCADFPVSDPTAKYVMSTRLCAGRNIRGFRLPPAVTKEERREVEQVAVKALTCLKGAYYPLRSSQSHSARPSGMTVDEEESLKQAQVLFQEPESSMLLASGMGKNWPDARGVYDTGAHEVFAWVNEEEHLRLFVEKSGDSLREAFSTLRDVHASLERDLKKTGHGFMHSDHLGFISSDPSNLGTGLTASITMKLPMLSAANKAKDVCRALSLEARKAGTADVWEVTRRPLLGVSEVQLVASVAQSCRQIVELEEALSRGKPLTIPGLGPEPLTGFPTGECPAAVPDLSYQLSVAAKIMQESPSLYAELRDRRTTRGGTFAQLIKGCVDARSSARAPIGLAASDEESYTAFAALWEPCLLQFHRALQAPALAKLDPADAGPLPSEVTSVRLRLSRNLTGLRMPAACSLQERREVERVLAAALEDLSGTLEGEYYPLAASQSFVGKPSGMTAAEESSLRSSGFLFQEPKDAMLLSMGFGRDWPDARGVFACNDRGLAATINEEDHVSLVATAKGGDFKAAVARLRGAERALALGVEQQGYRFVRSSRLGYLTAMPERLGTGLSVDVTLKLPQHILACADLAGLCTSVGLQLKRKLPGGSVEVVAKPTLGVSEAELLQATVEGCANLLIQ